MCPRWWMKLGLGIFIISELVGIFFEPNFTLSLLWSSAFEWLRHGSNDKFFVSHSLTRSWAYYYHIWQVVNQRLHFFLNAALRNSFIRGKQIHDQNRLTRVFLNYVLGSVKLKAHTSKLCVTGINNYKCRVFHCLDRVDAA